MINFTTAKFICSYGIHSQLPPSDSCELVFCGRSNVGKSTLINRLCNQRALARVSSTPGKTTTVNRFDVGDNYCIMDLPGYGYAKRPQAEKKRWAQLLEHFFTSGRNIALALLLLDARRVPNEDDITMLEYFRASGTPFGIVMTKCDKLKKTELAQSTAQISELCASYGAGFVLPFAQNDPKAAGELREKLASELLGEG